MSFEKIIFSYGLNQVDHKFSILYSQGAGSFHPIVLNEPPRAGYNPTTMNPLNAAEFVWTLRYYMRSTIDGNLTLFDTIHQSYSNPDTLEDERVYDLPAIAGSGTGGRGVTGQFIQYKGRTAVNTTSRHRLYGISSNYNNSGDNFSVGAGNAWGEFITLHNSLDCVAITNQLGTMRQTTTVRSYGFILRHNTDHHATKRFSY